MRSLAGAYLDEFAMPFLLESLRHVDIALPASWKFAPRPHIWALADRLGTADIPPSSLLGEWEAASALVAASWQRARRRVAWVAPTPGYLNLPLDASLSHVSLF